MGDTSGVFGGNPLQGWQREAIMKATQLLRDKFGNPPTDPAARQVHDGLLEVLDPARRTVRLQREMNDASLKASLTPRTERRGKERRSTDRRKVNLGPPPGTEERRVGERRSGKDRRNPR